MYSEHMMGKEFGVRELALHLLDIIENALRAGAGRVRVGIELDDAEEWLKLFVEDDGPGLPVDHEAALNPFFTTKSGKRTGLGLSLFQEAAERAGGTLNLTESPLGGLCVETTFEYKHIDRTPLGNVSDTMMTLVLSNPEILFECQIRGPGGATTLVSGEPADDAAQNNLFTSACAFANSIREALEMAHISE